MKELRKLYRKLEIQYVMAGKAKHDAIKHKDEESRVYFAGKQIAFGNALDYIAKEIYYK